VPLERARLISWDMNKKWLGLISWDGGSTPLGPQNIVQFGGIFASGCKGQLRNQGALCLILPVGKLSHYQKLILISVC
jgi:hypothetical protein